MPDLERKIENKTDKVRSRLGMEKTATPSMRLKLKREIFQAKFRFFAITLVVAIGVVIFVASSMSYRNLKTSYEYTYEKLNFADFRVKADRIPQYVVSSLQKIRGISLVTPRVRKDEAISLSSGKRLVGRITGLPFERAIVDDLLIKEGRYFKRGDRLVCIAESHFAKFYDLHQGDLIFLRKNGAEIPVKIIGVAGSPEYIVLAGEKGDFSAMISATSMAILWMPIRDVQQVAELAGHYNQVLFKVDEPENMDAVISSVEEEMKNCGIKEVITRDEHIGDRMLEMDLEGFRSFALFFPILFLAIACFSIYILLSRLVYIQRPFIGVMRAIGYTRRQILMHYLSFALMIGLLGAFFGVVGGYGLSYVVTKIYADTIGIPLVKIKVFWTVLFQGFFLSLFFCAVAGVVPAVSSARLHPSIAMRGEALQRVFKLPLIEKIIPAISRLPMFLKMPLRNMFRNRRRTFFTVTGLVFSVMLVLVFLGVLDTANDAMNRGFALNNRFDMVAVIIGQRDEALQDSIRRLPGVLHVEPSIAYNCKIHWNGYSMDSVLMGVKKDTKVKRFYTPDRKEVELSDRRVLMNLWFNKKKGIKSGDWITVQTTFGKKKFLVGEFIEEPMGNVIYLTREEAREVLGYGQTSRGGFYIKAAPGKAAAVRKNLEKIPGLAAIIDLEEIRREVDHYISMLYMIVYVMLVFALTMAFTLTFNTITINILEREREIATIRTIGTESWKISVMTTLENLIFGILSIFPGFLLGIAIANYAMSLQETEYFTISLVVYGRSYFLVALGIIMILLLCQIPSLRYVKKVELAKATKERGAG